MATQSSVYQAMSKQLRCSSEKSEAAYSLEQSRAAQPLKDFKIMTALFYYKTYRFAYHFDASRLVRVVEYFGCPGLRISSYE